MTLMENSISCYTYTVCIVSHSVVLPFKSHPVFFVPRSLVTWSVLQKYIAFIFLLLLFAFEELHLPLTNDISCLCSSCLPSLRLVGTFNSTRIHLLRFQWPITSSDRIDWMLLSIFIFWISYSYALSSRHPCHRSFWSRRLIVCTFQYVSTVTGGKLEDDWWASVAL